MLLYLLVAGVRVRATVVDVRQTDDDDGGASEYWLTVDYETRRGPVRGVRLSQLVHHLPRGSTRVGQQRRRPLGQAATERAVVSGFVAAGVVLVKAFRHWL